MTATESGASIPVARPVDEVFAFVAAPENDPRWVHGCVAIHRMAEAPIAVGSRLNERLRFAGLEFRYDWEVTRFEPGRLITYTSRRGLVPMVITIAAYPEGAATRVTQDIEMLLPWPLPFRGAFGRYIARREARRNLGALRDWLERVPRARVSALPRTLGSPTPT